MVIICRRSFLWASFLNTSQTVEMNHEPFSTCRNALLPEKSFSTELVKRQFICDEENRYDLQARRKRGGGTWGLQPPNNLLMVVDFVGEKGCKSQGRRNEYSDS